MPVCACVHPPLLRHCRAGIPWLTSAEKIHCLHSEEGEGEGKKRGEGEGKKRGEGEGKKRGEREGKWWCWP